MYNQLDLSLSRLEELEEDLKDVSSIWLQYRQDMKNDLIDICLFLGAVIDRKNISKFNNEDFKQIEQKSLLLEFSPLEIKKYSAILTNLFPLKEYYLFVSLAHDISNLNVFKLLFYQPKYELFVYFEKDKIIMPWLDVDMLDLDYMCQQVENNFSNINNNIQQKLQQINYTYNQLYKIE